jgi:hypothetical protein
MARKPDLHALFSANLFKLLESYSVFFRLKHNSSTLTSLVGVPDY